MQTDEYAFDVIHGIANEGIAAKKPERKLDYDKNQDL